MVTRTISFLTALQMKSFLPGAGLSAPMFSSLAQAAMMREQQMRDAGLPTFSSLISRRIEPSVDTSHLEELKRPEDAALFSN